VVRAFGVETAKPAGSHLPTSSCTPKEEVKCGMDVDAEMQLAETGPCEVQPGVLQHGR
jgi:hypothetical protein